MDQHLYIVTGASRGLGLAMAQQLLVPGHFLLCISRHVDEGLAAMAAAKGAGLEQRVQDLADTVAAAALLDQWLAAQPQDRFATATLINNAAVLPRVAPLGLSEPNEMARALRVGLEAPMQLTAAFLRGTETWASASGSHGVRKVLNISSGAGRRPSASQSIYSATKAGMDHFTHCLAVEEALKAHGARVCSLAPGVVDTDMQTHLRAADEREFPERERFVELKKNGQLTSPADAAARVLAWLTRADFGHHPVGDVREPPWQAGMPASKR